jgi:hypothetical protein
MKDRYILQFPETAQLTYPVSIPKIGGAVRINQNIIYISSKASGEQHLQETKQPIAFRRSIAYGVSFLLQKRP